MIVSSLCLINSESLQGFCHFHLNCNSHWWWLLFHLHSFPPCPTAANFFIDSCPIGTICMRGKFYWAKQRRVDANVNETRIEKSTFRVWSINAADSLTEPLAMPAVYLSCFCAGTAIGDKGPLKSSAKCFSELWEFACLLLELCIKMLLAETKKGFFFLFFFYFAPCMPGKLKQLRQNGGNI